MGWDGMGEEIYKITKVMSGEKRGRTERKKRDGEHPCIDPSILIDYHFYFILFCCIRHGIHQTQD